MKKINKRFSEPTFIESAKTLDNETITYKRFSDQTFSQEISNITFENCLFENCQFVGSIKNCTFYNVRFTKCDMANCLIERCGFHATLLEQDRMIGINIVDTIFKNVDILNSLMRLANFSSVTMNDVVLKDTNLTQSYFDSLTFIHLNLENVDLSRSEFVNTPLKNLDVRSSVISEIIVDPQMVKGMIVTEVEAIELIDILELTID